MTHSSLKKNSKFTIPKEDAETYSAWDSPFTYVLARNMLYLIREKKNYMFRELQNPPPEAGRNSVYVTQILKEVY